MTQVARNDSGAGAVVATVGCSVLGMILAGPVGAVIGGGLAIVATQAASSRGQLVPLQVTRISLPRDGIELRGGVKYFTVEVHEANGQCHRVLRRYRDFDQLRRAANQPRGFPGKLWFGCEGQRLEQRRRALEAWLYDLVLRFQGGVPPRLAKRLGDFLYEGRSPVSRSTFAVRVPYGVAAGQQLSVRSPEGLEMQITVPPGMGPGSILEVQRPQTRANAGASAASAPSAEAVPSFKVEAPEQKILLNIQVPEEVKPGQVLAVQVPDGRTLTVTVPPGTSQELQLEYDASKGTLTAVEATSDACPGDEVFQIQVPQGVQPGQVVNIQIPDGRQLPLTVPANKQPGDELVLCLDATRSKLLPA